MEINEQHNNSLDPMMAMATASLYGLENQQMVEEHFDDFVADMLSRFDNCREKILSLKPKGRMSGGITLPKNDNTFCFVSKIWYTIHRSTSDYSKHYWLKIGVNIREDIYNPMDLSKIYINRMTGGSLEEILEKMKNPKFVEKMKNHLGEWVYKSCDSAVMKMFDYDNDKNKNDNPDDNYDSNIQIDFGI